MFHKRSSLKQTNNFGTALGKSVSVDKSGEGRSSDEENLENGLNRGETSKRMSVTFNAEAHAREESKLAQGGRRSIHDELDEV